MTEINAATRLKAADEAQAYKQVTVKDVPFVLATGKYIESLNWSTNSREAGRDLQKSGEKMGFDDVLLTLQIAKENLQLAVKEMAAVIKRAKAVNREA